jgi:hypothetical protein
MTKVLIPFIEPEGAERAVRQFLSEANGSARDNLVELLAIVEPMHSETNRHASSDVAAKQLAREAASVWLARIAPLLSASSTPYHSDVVVGDRAEEIERAVHRHDIDRVILPENAARLREHTRPLTVVA